MIERIIEPNIVLPELDIPLIDSDNESQVARSLQYGILPIVFYRGFPIEPSNIIYFELDCTDFLPVVDVSFSDWSRKIISDQFPADDEQIIVYLNSRENNLTDVKMAFKVQEFFYNNEEDSLRFVGTIDVNELYYSNVNAFRDSTSIEVLKQFANQSGLGFASNVEETQDRMTWINPGRPFWYFIEDLTSRSYKSDDSFFWTHIDHLYNINFVDVEKQVRSNTKVPAYIETSTVTGLKIQDQEREPTDLVLYYGSDSFFGPNSFQITDYEVHNFSTKKSLKFGYKTRSSFYDQWGNWENKAGHFLDFIFETTRRPGSENESILLKGRVDGSNEEFYNNHIRGDWEGIQDVDNVHQNFQFSLLHNVVNTTELQKLFIIATLDTPNYNLYRFQNVLVVFFDDANLEGDIRQNPRLSGAWLIYGLSWKYSPEGGFQQEVILCRKELSIESDDTSTV